MWTVAGFSLGRIRSVVDAKVRLHIRVYIYKTNLLRVLPGQSPEWPSVPVWPCRPPSAASGVDTEPYRTLSPRSPWGGCGRPGRSEHWFGLRSGGRTPENSTEKQLCNKTCRLENRYIDFLGLFVICDNEEIGLEQQRKVTKTFWDKLTSFFFLQPPEHKNRVLKLHSTFSLNKTIFELVLTQYVKSSHLPTVYEEKLSWRAGVCHQSLL